MLEKESVALALCVEVVSPVTYIVFNALSLWNACMVPESVQECLCVFGARFNILFSVLLGCSGHWDPLAVVTSMLFVIWTNCPLKSHLSSWQGDRSSWQRHQSQYISQLSHLHPPSPPEEFYVEQTFNILCPAKFKMSLNCSELGLNMHGHLCFCIHRHVQ